MKIFALCLIKNEDDIIRQALLAASKWADKIFVYDNGSSDRTWEIVKETAALNPKIIPWKSDTKSFKENLFGDIFNQFRSVAEDGDWWCYLPADEFYADDPRSFLAAVPKGYHVIKHESIDYQLTFEDLEEFEFNENDEFNPDKVRYYLPKTWCERRFFKHRNRLNWPAGKAHPEHAGIIYDKKIKVRHYQYRSPWQIQKRLDTRRPLVEDGYKSFSHSAQLSYKDKIMHRSDLVKDTGTNEFRIEGARNHVTRKPVLDLVRKFAHQTGILP